MAKPKIVQAPRLNATPVANLTKRKVAGTEPTRPTTRDLSDTSNEKGTRILPPNNQQPNLKTNQKTSYAANPLWGNSRREGVFNRRSPYYIHQRNNKRIQWYTNGRLAETTSTCLHQTAIPIKGTGRNLYPRYRLPRRL